MDPLGANLALRAARRHVHSARPDAPVIPDPDRRAGRGRHEPRRAAGPVRRTVAHGLRRLADRLEPGPAMQ